MGLLRAAIRTVSSNFSGKFSVHGKTYEILNGNAWRSFSGTLCAFYCSRDSKFLIAFEYLSLNLHNI